MNNILRKTIVFISIFVLTSCSYEPIFVERDYNFKIKEVLLAGDKDINRIVNNNLKFIKNSESKKNKNFIIEIDSSKKREIVSKNSKGDPLKFKMIIKVKYKVLNNNSLEINNTIEKSNIYNNESDKFELEKNEGIILDNLARGISDNIISSIINLDDN
tara:strand:+ start:1715 stop:2191 length:477 start_codon:yes stop_codon:yes gene_type:complete